MMNFPDTIYLIGYMGSGKSTVGRKLADALDYQFIDTDLYIESRFRKSIAQMFAEEGEPVFRKRERILIEEIAGMPRTIISTGGGLPCFNENMSLLNESGYTIYLQRTVPDLAFRLEACRRTRPSVKELTGSELLEHVEKQFAEREPIYLQAHLVLPVLSLVPDDNEEHLVEFITSHLKNFRSNP